VLSDVVSRLLAKAPNERLATGARVVDALRSGETTVGSPRQAEASVAVLPFANMSADPDNEYFSDGITDDVIGALTPVKGLKVAARASSFAFKGKNAELAAIGSTLGVRTVVQGSVRRAGNRVRVTAQLMSTDGVQLWSQHYDRDLEDIFAIQDEIARAIVDQLQVRLGLKHGTGQLVLRPTDDLEAYQLYLRGREAANQRTLSSLRRAIDYYRQALARDANYARAHLGLADAYTSLGSYQHIPTTEAAREAAASLEAAERLRPDLALVHTLWGLLKLALRPDWHESGQHFERALALDPNEPLAHAYTAMLNGMLGNLERSKAAALRAVAADPLSVFVRALSVMGFPRDGIPGCDSAAALEAHEAALAMDPNSYLNLIMSAIRLSDVGRYDEALRRAAHAVELTQRGPLALGIYGRTLALSGRREQALTLRAELRDRAQREYVSPGTILMMVGLDVDDEAATAALIEANVNAMTGPGLIGTSVVRELEPLLDHPRLGPLVRRLTLWATRPQSPKPARPLTPATP
jgi:serine/threonine-protein kinase